MNRKDAKILLERVQKEFSKDFHNIFTPFELCDEMLNKIPELNKDMKILVMFNLEFVYVLQERWGKEGMKNVWFMTPCEIKKKVAIQMGVNENNVIRYEYNTKQIDRKDMPKFDVVVGNPPFQPPVKNGGAGKGSRSKIWQKFVEIGIESLNENGSMAFITPAGWRMGKTNGLHKNAQDLIWKNNIIDVFNVNNFFGNVGGNIMIDGWIITKNNSYKGLNINEFNKLIKFLPLNNKKIINDFLKTCSSENEYYELNIQGNDRRRFKHVIVKSEHGDKIAIYPHINTISQYKQNLFDWYDVKTNGYDNRKVMISDSVNTYVEGNFIAFYNNGEYGCGTHCGAYKIDNEEDAFKLVNFLNNSLIVKSLISETIGPGGLGVPLTFLRKIPKSYIERFNNGEKL